MRLYPRHDGRVIPPRRARIFSIPLSFTDYQVLSVPTPVLQLRDRTLRTSSISPSCMFVHVKCKTVSRLYGCDWVIPASSKLRSLVDPPAPHVTLIANGSRVARREIRATKFSKPYRTKQPVNSPAPLIVLATTSLDWSGEGRTRKYKRASTGREP